VCLTSTHPDIILQATAGIARLFPHFRQALGLSTQGLRGGRKVRMVWASRDEERTMRSITRDLTGRKRCRTERSGGDLTACGIAPYLLHRRHFDGPPACHDLDGSRLTDDRISQGAGAARWRRRAHPLSIGRPRPQPRSWRRYEPWMEACSTGRAPKSR
jgi:hypothetical protein